MYAMGWAQAEDRPEELLKNLLLAIGEFASIAGPAAVQSDTRSHMWDHYGVAKRRAGEMGDQARQTNRAYARGVNDYYAAHPEDLPQWWGQRKVDEFMIVAFGRLFLYNWSIDEAYGHLRRGGVQPGFENPQRGSNQWAVSPARSAVGAAILCIDPHLSWSGPSRFWAVRIHAGKLVGSGVTLAGFPGIGLGHNENLAWAMTTGGPDTADIYELTLKSDDPTKYLYDGKWRSLTSRVVELDVRGKGKQTITIQSSHHGPIVAMRNGKAYAAAMAYAESVRTSEAWNEMNYAKDYKGAVRAMETLQVFPQNVMVADTSGNIYYQRTGRVPIRSLDYDWSKPVDGSTSATEWQGLHPSSDYLQVLNPPQGYMQNCNIPPDAMMIDSPFDPKKTIPYIFGSLDYGPRGGWTNQRGARALDLLANDDSVTIQEALAYAVDIHPYGVERWLEILRLADQTHGKTYRANRDYATGIEDILKWDGNLNRDSTGALKYYYWREQLVKDHGNEAVAEIAKRVDFLYNAVTQEPRPAVGLTDEELALGAASFETAMTRLKADFGSIGAKYGDKFRVGREDKSWPVGGGGGYGTRTLRSISYGGEKGDHTKWGHSGQTSTQIVVLTKPIQSWAYIPIGESDRSDSPHFDDFAEKAFSERKLQPTWWQPKDLAKHIESRTVLEYAP